VLILPFRAGLHLGEVSPPIPIPFEIYFSFEPGTIWPFAFLAFTLGLLRYSRMYSARSSLNASLPCLNFWNRQASLQTAFLLVSAKNHRPHKHWRKRPTQPPSSASSIIFRN